MKELIIYNYNNIITLRTRVYVRARMQRLAGKPVAKCPHCKHDLDDSPLTIHSNPKTCWEGCCEYCWHSLYKITFLPKEIIDNHS
jgi:hypothetical protein